VLLKTLRRLSFWKKIELLKIAISLQREAKNSRTRSGLLIFRVRDNLKKSKEGVKRPKRKLGGILVLIRWLILPLYLLIKIEILF